MTTQLEPLMERNFLEYASYVILDRAIPDLRDGFKPVQRRIMATLASMDDGKFHKVANVIGETMKLHPHGDASIGDALVVLANKDYFIEKQGNFGNVITGHKAAAARYIECRLTPLARETMFNGALTETRPSYDGRKREPVSLPAKLPVQLMLGTEGIAVGMATRVLPHNLPELWAAQIKIIRGRKFELVPDFPHGGRIDPTDYDDGRGRVKVRARVRIDGPKRIVITEIPWGTTTESVIASIEGAAQKGKVKISSIQDYTTDHVEIEVTPVRGVDADEVVPQLWAYTDCEVSASSNIVVIRDGHPQSVTVSDALRDATHRLVDILRRELEHEHGRLADKHHWLTLEQLFIENRVYKRIEEAKTDRQVRAEVRKGMEPFAELFIRPMVDDDIGRLLDIKIRRISRYDINKNRKDIDDIVRAIDKVDRKLADMAKTTIDYLKDLIARYGDAWPRRTEVTRFGKVDKRAIAAADIKVGYDPETGFLGTTVKSKDHQMAVTEFDRILAVTADGTFRIIDAPEKMLLPEKVLYLGLFDEKKGQSFVVVYRTKDKMLYGKRVHIEKYVRGREYRLVRDKGGRIVFLTPDRKPGVLHMQFVPAPRQRVKEGTFDLAKLRATAITARGTRLATKPVSRVKVVRPKK